MSSLSGCIGDNRNVHEALQELRHEETGVLDEMRHFDIELRVGLSSMFGVKMGFSKGAREFDTSMPHRVMVVFNGFGKAQMYDMHQLLEFGSVFADFALNEGVTRDTCRFSFNEKTLEDSDTPSSFLMTNYDIVDVAFEPTGR